MQLKVPQPPSPTLSSTTLSVPPYPLSASLAYDHLLKIILLGDAGIGKSSMLLRYHRNKFFTNYLTTIGINTVWAIEEVEGVRIKLQIWDTAGQEKFRTITRNYYRGCHGVVVAFSLTSRESYNSIKTWIDQLYENLPSANKDSIQLTVVGTKTDLVDEREVSFVEAQEFCSQYGIIYLECSAKSGDGVKQIFRKLAQRMKHKFIDERLKQPDDEEEDDIEVGIGMGRNKGKIKLGKDVVLRFGKDMHNRCCQN